MTHPFGTIVEAAFTLFIVYLLVVGIPTIAYVAFGVTVELVRTLWRRVRPLGASVKPE